MADISSRYKAFSYKTRLHRGKPIKDITDSKGWNKTYSEISKLPSNVAVIPAGYEGRPDLLSFKLYGTSSYWWLLCVANSIIDPFEQLTAGKQIIVPIID
jgi:hypothetical protein